MEANLTPPEGILDQTSDQETQGWKVSGKTGKEYTSRGDGTNAPLYRQGDETPDQARTRYEAQKTAPKGKAKDKRPKARIKNAPKAEAPTKVDLKELEHQLAEALKAPAIAAALYGDEYLSDHFSDRGPVLARNLVAAAEHNPWLRKKLEEFASGDTVMIQLMTIVPVISASVFYVAPPLIYLLNLPVPETTRSRFGIPHRKPAYAHPDASPQPLKPPDPQRPPAGPSPTQPHTV